MKHHYKRTQKGAMTVDGLLITGFIIIALIYIISKGPTLAYKWNKIQFTTDVSDIINATRDWKKARPNFDGVSLKKICDITDLSDSICGRSGDGKSTNSFGGDWSVSVNSSKGLFDIKATLPNDTDRIADIADTMAPSTRSGCIEADGCSTISTSTSSVTMTF
ncbi:hypothetical protein A6E02_19720 [Aliivibrio fischeri]|nr:hypothetical protein A6E02_19720 [Aliivibrio fischeri]